MYIQGLLDRVEAKAALAFLTGCIPGTRGQGPAAKVMGRGLKKPD